MKPLDTIKIGCILLLFLGVGCQSTPSSKPSSKPSEADRLLALHVPIVMQSSVVSQEPWSIDGQSFMTAHSIEISTMGGNTRESDKGYGGTVFERMKGDFYNLFESDANALMESLFGPRSTENSNSSKCLLQIEIGRVHSKIPLMGFSKAQFDIEIRFQISRIVGGQTRAYQTTINSHFESSAGSTLSAHAAAHKRATMAINKAFNDAQKELRQKLLE